MQCDAVLLLFQILHPAVQMALAVCLLSTSDCPPLSLICLLSG